MCLVGASVPAPNGDDVMANKITEAVAIVEHPNLTRIEVIDETGRAYVRRGV